MRALLLWVALCSACAVDLAAPQPRGPRKDVEVLPDGSLDAAPSVVRLRMSYVQGDEEAVLLFAGELSRYHEGRVRRADLPKTLLERRVETVGYREQAGWVIAPLAPLVPLERYSLVRVGAGTLAPIVVREGDRSPLSRRWPLAAMPSAVSLALFCGDQAPPGPLPAQSLTLVPGGDPIWASVADFGPHLGAGCVGLRPEEPLSLSALAPLAVGGSVLEPSLLSPGDPVWTESPPCPADTHDLELACLAVEDDRLVFTQQRVAALWMVSVAGRQESFALSPAARQVIGGLSPSQAYRVETFSADATGVERSRGVDVVTSEPRARVVVSEVMANPVGPEPAQEWVELYNDGLVPVALEGYRLSDGAAEYPLEAALLEPGAFALVVRHDFDADSVVDHPPAAATVLVRVAQLGKNGLANGGEPITLSRPDGELVSRFPARSASKAGRSIARRKGAFDDDAAGFLPHGPPGASPGLPNGFE